MFENFIVEFVKPHRRYFLAIILIAYFFLIASFAFVLSFVNSQNLGFDLQISQFIQNFNDPLLENVMIFVSLFGSGFYPLIPFLIAGFWLYKGGFRQEALILPFAFIAPLISEISKTHVARPRPTSEQVFVYSDFSGFSFPSGHVLFYTIFFGFLAFLAISLPKIKPIVRGVLLIICISLILLVGISRIYLGAHWPTDVLAAYLVGLATLELLIVLYLKEIYLPKMRKKQNEANHTGKN